MLFVDVGCLSLFVVVRGCSLLCVVVMWCALFVVGLSFGCHAHFVGK